MTGEMEYGRGKRKHDKRDLSDDKYDGASSCGKDEILMAHHRWQRKHSVTIQGR